MELAVFLCNKNWIIEKIRMCDQVLGLREGDDLTQITEEGALLQAAMREEYALSLTFSGKQLTVSAVLHHFTEGNLVVLSDVKTTADFLAFQNTWPEHVEWAKDHLVGLYHDEYFQIQRINNQLVDAQRALVRSNVQLEQAVKENRKINAKLEEAKLSAEEAMEKARQASQSKSNFLANMSHDIRTPMNAIVGIASLMEHHLDDPHKLGSYIEKLQYSSQYLLDLINDVLDLSKIENGSLQLKLEAMDLASQIEQILVILRPKTKEKKQTLRAEYATLQPRTLQGDPVRLRQILMNLLSNAVKYTPENGEIRFTVQQSEIPEKNGVCCRFVVSDTGIGMTPEFQKHIFEPFSRAERVSGKIQGTGLGMAITKNIVDAMGGTIRIESTLHEGSSFTVELFMAYSDHPLTEREMVMEVAEKEQEDRQTLSGMHFLCAEDNALNAEILSSMLELSGASCDIYGDGKQLVEAFAAVRPGEYDAILMDVQMPVMNGYEATAAIRQGANPLGRTIPVIAMTANAFAEDIQRSLDVGMNAHISKPVDLQVLQEVMRKYRQ